MFSRKSKPIIDRCEADMNTRLRLKYAPYYRVVDSADGVNLVVEGLAALLFTRAQHCAKNPRMPRPTQPPAVDRVADGEARMWQELRLTPVESAQTAVRATIAGKAQK